MKTPAQVLIELNALFDLVEPGQAPDAKLFERMKFVHGEGLAHIVGKNLLGRAEEMANAEERKMAEERAYKSDVKTQRAKRMEEVLKAQIRERSFTQRLGGVPSIPKFTSGDKALKLSDEKPDSLLERLARAASSGGAENVMKVLKGA